MSNTQSPTLDESPDGEYLILEPPPLSSAVERRFWDSIFKYPMAWATSESRGDSNRLRLTETALGALDENTPPSSPDSTIPPDSPTSPSSSTDTLIELIDAPSPGTKADFVPLSSVSTLPTRGLSGHALVGQSTTPYIGEYAKLLANVPPSNFHILASQSYIITLSMSQDVPPELKETLPASQYSSNFKLVVDTCSDVTWLYGYGFRELLPNDADAVPRDSGGAVPGGSGDAVPGGSGDARASVPPQAVHGTSQPKNDLQPTANIGDAPLENKTNVKTRKPHHNDKLPRQAREWTTSNPHVLGNSVRETYFYTGYHFEPGPGEKRLDKGVLISQIDYVGGTSGVVTLIPKWQDVTILGWYKWARYSDVSPMHLSYRFATAIAVTPNLRNLPGDGILALGLRETQDVFKGQTSTSAPSFLTQLEKLRQLRDPDTNEGGTVLYFLLRPHPDHPHQQARLKKGLSTLQSILAFNRWPSPNHIPAWSPPLRISKSISSKPSTRYWSVILMSFGLVIRDRNHKDEYVKDSIISFDKAGGVEVALDTGSSLSYLPSEIVQNLRTKIFPTEENQRIEKERTNPPIFPGIMDRKATEVLPRPWEPAFKIPKDKYPLAKWGVALTFQVHGVNKTERIVFPCDPFLATTNPKTPDEKYYEGLICDGPVPGSTSIYVLGVNFYQSALVALHKPDINPLPWVNLNA